MLSDESKNNPECHWLRFFEGWADKGRVSQERLKKMIKRKTREITEEEDKL